jgi:hypothetical protein
MCRRIFHRKPVRVSRCSAADDASTGRYETPSRRNAVARRRSPRLTNAIAAASQVNSWRIMRPTVPMRPKLTCAVQRPNKSAPATTRHARCRLLAGSRACNSIRISFMDSDRTIRLKAESTTPESPDKAINHPRRCHVHERGRRMKPRHCQFNIRELLPRLECDKPDTRPMVAWLRRWERDGS